MSQSSAVQNPSSQVGVVAKSGNSGFSENPPPPVKGVRYPGREPNKWVYVFAQRKEKSDKLTV